MILMKKIKSIKSWVTYGNETFLKSFVEFDEMGHELRKETYFGPNELESKTLSVYNEKGFLIEETNFGEDNLETDKISVERDNDGNPLKTILSYADGSQTIKSYQREEYGKLITIQEVSDEEEFESKECIRLDDKRNVIERTSYNEENKIIEQLTFVFDEKQNIIKEITFNGTNKFSESSYTYDAAGNLIKKIITSASGETIDWALFSYDENGKLTEQQYGDHTLYKIEYNEKGMATNEKKINAMGVVDYIKNYVYNESDELIEENDLTSKTTFEYDHY
jgi:hypothetical protein